MTLITPTLAAAVPAGAVSARPATGKAIGGMPFADLIGLGAEGGAETIALAGGFAALIGKIGADGESGDKAKSDPGVGDRVESGIGNDIANDIANDIVSDIASDRAPGDGLPVATGTPLGGAQALIAMMVDPASRPAAPVAVTPSAGEGRAAPVAASATLSSSGAVATPPSDAAASPVAMRAPATVTAPALVAGSQPAAAPVANRSIEPAPRAASLPHGKTHQADGTAPFPAGQNSESTARAALASALARAQATDDSVSPMVFVVPQGQGPVASAQGQSQAVTPATVQIPVEAPAQNPVQVSVEIPARVVAQAPARASVAPSMRPTAQAPAQTLVPASEPAPAEKVTTPIPAQIALQTAGQIPVQARLQAMETGGEAGPAAAPAGEAEDDMASDASSRISSEPAIAMRDEWQAAARRKPAGAARAAHMPGAQAPQADPSVPAAPSARPAGNNDMRVAVNATAGGTPGATPEPQGEAAPLTGESVPMPAGQVQVQAAAQIGPSPAQAIGASAGAAGPSTAEALGARVIDMGVDGQWIDRMAGEITRLSQGTGHSQFVLMPPHLGRIEVSLIQREAGADVRFVTETDEAADRIRGAQASLQADARLAAMSLGVITVEKGQPGSDASGRDGGQSQAQSQSQSQAQAQSQHFQSQTQTQAQAGGQGSTGRGAKDSAPAAVDHALETSDSAGDGAGLAASRADSGIRFA